MMKNANISAWLMIIALLLVAGIAAGCPQQEGGGTAAASADGVETAAEPGADAAFPPEEALVVNAAPPGASASLGGERETIEARPTYPADYVIHFTNAKHAGKPGALSSLGFSIELSQDSNQLATGEAYVSADEPVATATMDLPEYRIEFTPQIDPPIKLSAGQYGSYGGYSIMILNAGLKPMAAFEVNKVAKITKAESQGDYELRLLLAAPEEKLYTYLVFSTDGSTSEPLMAIDLQLAEFEPREATDSAGGTYTYRFPELEVTVHGSLLAKTVQRTRNSDQQAVSQNVWGGVLW